MGDFILVGDGSDAVREASVTCSVLVFLLSIGSPIFAHFFAFFLWSSLNLQRFSFIFIKPFLLLCPKLLDLTASSFEAALMASKDGPSNRETIAVHGVGLQNKSFFHHCTICN